MSESEFLYTNSVCESSSDVSRNFSEMPLSLEKVIYLNIFLFVFVWFPLYILMEIWRYITEIFKFVFVKPYQCLYGIITNQFCSKKKINISNTKMIPMATLNNGCKMPLFGLGTYSLKEKEGEEAIKYAIDVGYRHFDTANFYGNEREVGNAIREKISDGTVKREDLFITTKLNLKMHREDLVIDSCKESLNNLGLDYIDMYLIHSPVSLKETNDSTKVTPSNIDYVETWRGMEQCKKRGLARGIGVSNFNSEQLTRLMSMSDVQPSNNQIEVTLHLNQEPLIKFCKEHSIVVTGYSPLGKPGKRPNIGNLLLNPKVISLSEKYGKTPAQIALRFVFQMGAAPIPKSASKSRISENIQIFDFALSPEDMDILKTLETGARVVPMDDGKGSEYFPFNIPF